MSCHSVEWLISRFYLLKNFCRAFGSKIQCIRCRTTSYSRIGMIEKCQNRIPPFLTEFVSQDSGSLPSPINVLITFNKTPLPMRRQI